MHKEMTRLTLAIVGRTLFSADVSSDADEIGRAMTQIFELFDTLLLPFSDWIQKLPIPPVRRFEKARDRLDKIVYGLIAERRASGKDAGDLLSMLLLAQDESDNAHMTDKQVRDEALTLLIAGHETTANALTWTWYLLSQNPDVEARMHAEIDSALGGEIAGETLTIWLTCTTPAEYPPNHCGCIRRLGPSVGARGRIIQSAPTPSRRNRFCS